MRFFLLSLLTLFACHSVPESPKPKAQALLTSLSDSDHKHPDFDAYWYNGEAELSSYTLQQARYGEVHEGEAVLVFVTEPYSRKNHVKADNAPASDRVDILKLNMTKKFNTGIYPYSMMLSSFTPVDRKQDGPSMRVTCTSQEWCGHTFTQLDYRKNQFEVQDFSYFPSEGDRTSTLPGDFLEDEIFTLLRINPKYLPEGELKIIPSTFIARLKHLELKSYSASAEMLDHPTDSKLKRYRVEWPHLNRDLTIDFQAEFPFTIEYFEENYSSGWGAGAKKLKTTATRKKTIKLDYWSRNAVSDTYLRKELGLNH